GRYKWIVFLPCKTTGVGALNRYYGLFQDDEFKLRGIELRKHDTPEFINICQEAMLGELSLASTAAEFLERIPKAVDILRWTAKCVLDRTIPVHQFILTKSVSRTLTEYVVLTATAAALKQLEKRGFPVEPGESVRYVLMDARARDSERKVRVAEFLEGDETPDAWEYLKLLARSGQRLQSTANGSAVRPSAAATSFVPRCSVSDRIAWQRRKRARPSSNTARARSRGKSPRASASTFSSRAFIDSSKVGSGVTATPPPPGHAPGPDRPGTARRGRPPPRSRRPARPRGRPSVRRSHNRV